MQIVFNGQLKTLIKRQTLQELVGSLQLPGKEKGIALCLNDEIVPQSAWNAIHLKDQDVLEVVQATQGG